MMPFINGGGIDICFIALSAEIYSAEAGMRSKVTAPSVVIPIYASIFNH